MSTVMPIYTPRLILREWRETDLKLFADINADLKVMEFFPAPLTLEQSNAYAASIRAEFEKREFGYWAVEIPNTAPFIGYIGLRYSDYEAHFTPCIEISWRLAFNYWKQGYATEGARAVMNYAFDCLKIEEIVSTTYKGNEPSIKVMERLGMHRNPQEDYKNTRLPPDDRLSPHVLYRLRRSEWPTPIPKKLF